MNIFWILEKENQENGGDLKWGEHFRFKNLE